MASKQMKKEKKKLLKLKQKEITLNNKELKKNTSDKTELLRINKNEFPDIEDMIELTGPRGYVLKILKEMVYDLNNGTVPDSEIQIVAQFLIEFAKSPITVYKEVLKSSKINLPKKKLNLMSRRNINLNTTERALLKNRMQGVLMEYGFKNTDVENIDYSGIRVYFEMTYRLILVGLKEMKIRSIEMYVGYGDSIYDLSVNYMDDDSKYNLTENPFISVHFNALDNLYNTYAIYKNTYKNFSESSLQSLATASDTAKEYESRDEGKDIVSYNGIVLNYVGVLEFELKKLISSKFNLNPKKLKLVDAINRLGKLNDDFLSNHELIDDLHKIRLLRNKVAHGDSITRDEFLYIRTTLLSRRTLEYISWQM